MTLAAMLAFAAGVVVGLYCGCDCLNCVRSGRQAPSDAIEANASTGAASAGVIGATERVPSETTVEVTYSDFSSETSPDITAAHRARRAKRAAVREAKTGKRRDFLASLNVDLLTPSQRELHAEYSEAVTVRDAVRREMDALRAMGDDVPDSLRTRFADAQSVIRADADQEHRALREAAVRAHGLDDAAIGALLDDLDSIDSVLIY